jgi:hypothetical protein
MAKFPLLHPSETELVGAWVLRFRMVKADKVLKRIEWLIENVLVANENTDTDWETQYVDPADDRLWKLHYPQSHLHGGGPPSLTIVND